MSSNRETDTQRGLNNESVDHEDADIQFLSRKDLLKGVVIPGEESDEIAVLNFLRELTGDENIVGVAISTMRLGGVYTHVIVKDLPDREAMRRTLETTGRSWDYLQSAARQPAGYHSYMQIGDNSPEEFAIWFREEFHKPPKYNNDSNEGMLNFFELAGSSEELEFGHIVMFE